MAINIKELERRYFYKGKPVPYKLFCGVTINIYPVMLEDSDIFEENFDILTFEKNEIPTAEIIQMSYLEFLFEIMFKEVKNQNKLYNIIELCLKEKDIRFGYEKNKPVLVICENDMIKSKVSHKDFDDLKKIILYQNINGYDDTYISKDIKKIMEEYWRAKNGNMEQLSLEDKMAFLGNNSGLLKEDMLKKMTYREFNKRFNWMVEQMDYQINKSAEMSGNVKFDKPVEHLIYRKSKNKYEQFFSDKDNFVNKIKNA